MNNLLALCHQNCKGQTLSKVIASRREAFPADPMTSPHKLSCILTKILEDPEQIQLGQALTQGYLEPQHMRPYVVHVLIVTQQ